MKHFVLVCAAALLLVGAQARAAAITEGFDNGIPANWVMVNNSNPVGTDGDYQAAWHQSDDGDMGGFFGPHTGAGYACARDASVSNEGSIDNWMLTPVMTFNVGDTVSFYTRAVLANSDSLEVRLSTAGSGANCGVQALDNAGAAADFPAFLANVGDFSTLVGSVNPWAADGSNLNVYPLEWTQQTFTVTTAGTGRLGFRYLVPDGGMNGANSWVIGVDDLQVTPVPEPATMSLLVVGGVAALLRRRHA